MKTKFDINNLKEPKDYINDIRRQLKEEEIKAEKEFDSDPIIAKMKKEIMIKAYKDIIENMENVIKEEEEKEEEEEK